MAVTLADEADLAVRDDILRGRLRLGTPLSPGFHALLADGLVSGDPGRADAVMRERRPAPATTPTATE